MTTMMSEPARRGAVIFDRDGVLNRDAGYAFRPDQIAWVEDAAAAVRAVNDAGLFAFVATNQSGIGRGLYTEDDMHALHAWMRAELARAGARLDDIVYSPWHPEAVVERYRKVSDWRKPGPGMILDLLARHPVDTGRVVMIGDKDTDIQAAEAAGIPGLKFEGGSLLRFVEPVIATLSP
jgi:D-glycero-D-manno-heptose 1,7-bisphosphate phosphatase